MKALKLWQYRGLLWAFVKRDVHERIAGSVFGPVLLILQPLSQILIYVFLFKYVFKVRIRLGNQGSEDFLRFFLVGFVPWSIHAEAILRAANSLLAQGHLLKKVLFPPEILPLSSVCGTYLLGIPALSCLALILALAGGVSWEAAFSPLIYVLQFFFSLGISLFFAAVLVYLRDLQLFLGIIISVWFYASPILYSVEMLPEKLRLLLWLNPYTYMVHLWQTAFLGHQLVWLNVVVSVAATLFFFLGGWWFFNRCKEGFTDVL